MVAPSEAPSISLGERGRGRERGEGERERARGRGGGGREGGGEKGMEGRDGTLPFSLPDKFSC